MKRLIGITVSLLVVANCEQTSLCDETASQQEIAKYERWVQEVRAKDALSRSILEERTDAFELTVADLEARLAATSDPILLDIKNSASDISEEEKIALFDRMHTALNASPE